MAVHLFLVLCGIFIVPSMISNRVWLLMPPLYIPTYFMMFLLRAITPNNAH